MKHYYPAYYNEFRCIAAACPDSCCQGWDVVIDSDAEAFYTTVQGELGDRLRRAIYTDADGDRVFRLADEKKCPFWGTDKLCEIHKNLGEEHLSVTCARFPRLLMDYTTFTEHSLALACPEAARLIAETDSAYADFTHSAAAPCEDYDGALMTLLLQARRETAALLTSDKPLSERFADCLTYSRAVQSRLLPALSDLPCSPAVPVELYEKLEYIDSRDRGEILRACRATPDLSGREAELQNLSLYFLYRYYLGAVNTLDVLAPVRHMIASVTVISALARIEDLSTAEAAQLYSKEVEQSYENMERIWDHYESDA